MRRVLLLIASLLAHTPAWAQPFPVNQPAPPPVLAFTDLRQGNRSGNTDTSKGQSSGVDGAIVTLWGYNLGSSQGSSALMVGGVAPRAIYYWGNATPPNCGPATLYNQYQKLQCVIFQISGSTPTGSQNIVVTVGSSDSNPLAFTVTSTGSILYAAPEGRGSGTFSAPYGNVQTMANALKAGDVGYIKDGFGTVLGFFAPNVTASNTGHVALATYPGATIRVGDATHDGIAGVFSGFGGDITYSKLDVMGAGQAVTVRENAALIGNRFQCPNGVGSLGCVGIYGSNVKMLGNEVTNTGTANRAAWDDLYHVVYVYGRRSQPTPFLESGRELGWNYLHDNRANRGFNIYNGEPNGSNPISNHNVHDNVIVNQENDAILFGRGTVGNNWATNNLIINAGLHNVDQSSSSGLMCLDFQMTDPPGVSIPHDPIVTTVWNNTVLNCGSAGGSSGHTGVMGFRHSGTVRLFNNIFYQQSVSYPYHTTGGTNQPSGPDRTKYSNNLWFGSGSSPSWDTSPVNRNPMLVAAGGTYDLHLRASSPAIGHGVAVTTPSYDFDGTLRPSSGRWDIGAYQASSAPATSKLNIEGGEQEFSARASRDPDLLEAERKMTGDDLGHNRSRRD